MLRALLGTLFVLALNALSPASAQPLAVLPGAMAAAAASQYYGGDRGEVECSSTRNRRVHCPVPWRDANLVRQLSHSVCIKGRTWDVYNGAIWVDQGCRGVFVEMGRPVGPRPPGPGGWAPGPDWDRSIILRCGSPRYRYNFCEVDTGRGGRVKLRRQLSNTWCDEGRNWGYNRAGIWVDDGCAGEFEVLRRWR